MYDWIYAIPLCLIILSAGITYFIPSFLLGPFYITIFIAIIIFLYKYNKKENDMDYYVELWCHYPHTYRETIFGPYSEEEAEEKADELDNSIDLEFFSCAIINDEDIVED